MGDKSAIAFPFFLRFVLRNRAGTRKRGCAGAEPRCSVSAAAAAGGAAAGAGSGGLLHRHRVAAVHRGVDDGVDIVDQELALPLGLVVGHHPFVVHDLAVEGVHLLVQLGDAGVVALRFADLVVQVHPCQIELPDHVLQLFVAVVHLAGLVQGQVAAVGLERHGGALKEVDAIHCGFLLCISTFYYPILSETGGAHSPSRTVARAPVRRTEAYWPSSAGSPANSTVRLLSSRPVRVPSARPKPSTSTRTVWPTWALTRAMAISSWVLSSRAIRPVLSRRGVGAGWPAAGVPSRLEQRKVDG